MIRASLIYGLLAVFLFILNVVYTIFSYGVTSPYMQWMFLFPLIGGAIPALLLSLWASGRYVTRPVANLWNSGIATLTTGCLIRGIINISGRFTDYDLVYWIIGGAFLLAGILTGLISALQNPRDV